MIFLASRACRDRASFQDRRFITVRGHSDPLPFHYMHMEVPRGEIELIPEIEI